MPHTLASFALRIRDHLAADPGPAGRERVRRELESVLLLPAFVAEVGDEQPQRRVLYHDTELGFSILGHVYHGARRAPPHDHGPTWAIYGQVSGETIMDEWSVVEPATPERPGTLRLSHSYRLTPGKAHLYNEGVIHSPRREAAASLIRIEGGPLGGGSRPGWQVLPPD